MAKTKIEKYAIHGDHRPADEEGFHGAYTTWWARVPWGTFQSFDTWAEAAKYLSLRHRLKTEHKPYRRGRNGTGDTTLGA